MRKIFLILLCFITFVQGCSRSEYIPLEQENLEADINLPKTSDDYGKAVAKEIRNIVNNLNDKGYNFSEIKSKKEIEQFSKQIYAASSRPELASTNNNFFNSDPIEAQNRINELTESQQKIIRQITYSYGRRKSDQDFKNSLRKITKDVFEKVPIIEQERLFDLIAILYYSLSEIQQLEKKGQVVRHNRQNLILENTPRLKAFSESGESSTGTTCREEETIINYAIGFLNSAGEKVIKVVRGAGAALGTYLVLWCKVQDQTNIINYCASIYSDCHTPGNHRYWFETVGGKSRCQLCMEDCIRSGAWTCSRNFKAPQ